MFEEKTFESLLQEKLSRVNTDFDRREGSVIYDAMAPNSAETAQAYSHMDWIFRQMFGDTAEREYLCKIAMDTRGLKPKEATKAIVKGRFNQPVAEGSRFTLDGIYYTVREKLNGEEFCYKLECEQYGEEGNQHFGTLLPVDYMEGLTEAEITEILIPGEKEEATESFRQRWRDAFASKAFGGNKADYREKIKAIEGVGGVKVYRAQDENGKPLGGHVRCVIIASDNSAPSEILVSQVQTEIDPEVYAGEGVGLAPIGHTVHIEAVKERKIDISSRITYEEGYTFEDVKSYLEAAVDQYFQELNAAWEGSSQLAVRIAQLESSFLKVRGVLDIAGTTLNGAEQNVLLDSDSIVVRGELHG